MSRHSGPHYTAPDDERCEALVPGHPDYNWRWMRVDHRCPRRANQGRDGHIVCFQHAAAKTVTYFNPEKERVTP
jgi:hypothetical protein